MRLPRTTHQRGYTRDRDNTSPSWLLLGHLVGDGSRDVEASVQVDVLYPFPELVRHVEEGVKRADAGVGDEDVDSGEGFKGFADDLQRG